MDVYIYILHTFLSNVKCEVGQISIFVIFKPSVSILMYRSNEGNSINPIKY